MASSKCPKHASHAVVVTFVAQHGPIDLWIGVRGAQTLLAIRIPRETMFTGDGS